MARGSICPAHQDLDFARRRLDQYRERVASGAFANGRSLPLAVLTRRLNPDLGVPNI